MGHIGDEELNHEVAWPLQSGQGQVGVPQVPHLGHGVAHRGLVRDLEADAVCKFSTFLWLT